MILFYIISYDIWFYISHIFLHRPYIYKTIHKIHHSLDYTSMHYQDTYVGHWGENVIQGLGIFFPLVFITFYADVFLYSLIFINVRGMMQHDSRFTFLIGNHHILHHKHPNYNFGQYWLDKLAGTAYPKSIQPKI